MSQDEAGLRSKAEHDIWGMATDTGAAELPSCTGGPHRGDRPPHPLSILLLAHHETVGALAERLVQAQDQRVVAQARGRVRPGEVHLLHAVLRAVQLVAARRMEFLPANTDQNVEVCSGLQSAL